MKLFDLALILSSSWGLVQATPTARASKPPYFFLIGDSTVAAGGGWGDGLLSYLKDSAKGENRGEGGSTTVSWKANGRWEDLIEDIEANKDDYEPIVTVQFGHNDQKDMELEEFETNMVDIAAEIEEAGGTPILITSLTRRDFEDGEVNQGLKDWSEKTIEAAEEAGVQSLNLNNASTTYVNTIGEENATQYNLDDDDGTHLNSAGEAVFGRMTLDLLLEAREDLDPYFEPNDELSDKISKGEFATGDEQTLCGNDMGKLYTRILLIPFGLREH